MYLCVQRAASSDKTHLPLSVLRRDVTLQRRRGRVFQFVLYMVHTPLEVIFIRQVIAIMSHKRMC